MDVLCGRAPDLKKEIRNWHVSEYIYTHIYMDICIYVVCMYACMYVCQHTYICIYATGSAAHARMPLSKIKGVQPDNFNSVGTRI